MLEPDRNYEFDGFADGPPATPVGLPRARGGGVERMDQGGMGPMGLDTAFVSLGSGFDNPALAGAAAVGGQMLAGEVTRMQSKVRSVLTHTHTRILTRILTHTYTYTYTRVAHTHPHTHPHPHSLPLFSRGGNDDDDGGGGRWEDG